MLPVLVMPGISGTVLRNPKSLLLYGDGVRVSAARYPPQRAAFPRHRGNYGVGGNVCLRCHVFFQVDKTEVE